MHQGGEGDFRDDGNPPWIMPASPQRSSLGARKAYQTGTQTPHGARQGMYVAYVKNAMLQKAQVCTKTALTDRAIMRRTTSW